MNSKPADERVEIRAAVLEVLELISSKEKQIEYQKNVSLAQVPAELFCRWGDIYLFKDDPATYKAIFSSSELNILEEFDAVLGSISEATPNELPLLTDFIATDEWKKLSDAAANALSKLSKLKRH